MVDRDKPENWDNEKVVVRDHKQENWVYRLNPRSSYTKFRPLWVKGLYKDDDVMFPYLQGEVYYQSWVGATSTEIRLVPTRNKEGNYYSVLWDCKAYEDILSAHNIEHRDIFYINPFNPNENDGLELTNDWDSLNEVQILRIT